MLKTNIKQKGFTIVELLIVIVVIGILAALVLNTFAGVQERARDTERQTDVDALVTQLEVYYNDHGSYPTSADLANDAWVAGNLKGIADDTTRAPGDTANSVTAATAATKDDYGYVTTPAGAACASPTTAAGADVAGITPCTAFVISYFTEKDDAAVSQNSLNN